MYFLIYIYGFVVVAAEGAAAAVKLEGSWAAAAPVRKAVAMLVLAR